MKINLKKFDISVRDFLILLFSAILLILSFPKTDLWFLAWIGLVPFFILIENLSTSKALKYSLIFGFIFHYGNIFWLNCIKLCVNFPAALYDFEKLWKSIEVEYQLKNETSEYAQVMIASKEADDWMRSMNGIGLYTGLPDHKNQEMAQRFLKSQLEDGAEYFISHSNGWLIKRWTEHGLMSRGGRISRKSLLFFSDDGRSKVGEIALFRSTIENTDESIVLNIYYTWPGYKNEAEKFIKFLFE